MNSTYEDIFRSCHSLFVSDTSRSGTTLGLPERSYEVENCKYTSTSSQKELDVLAILLSLTLTNVRLFLAFEKMLKVVYGFHYLGRL